MTQQNCLAAIRATASIAQAIAKTIAKTAAASTFASILLVTSFAWLPSSRVEANETYGQKQSLEQSLAVEGIGRESVENVEAAQTHDPTPVSTSAADLGDLVILDCQVVLQLVRGTTCPSGGPSGIVYALPQPIQVNQPLGGQPDRLNVVNLQW